MMIHSVGSAILTVAALLLLCSTTPVVADQGTAVPIAQIPIDPLNLAAAGCESTDRFDCPDAPWVYCIDAQCDTPDIITGISLCYCWIQTPARSQLPAAADAGAPCVISNTSNGAINNPAGEAMCASMREGELWSTFGYLSVNTSYLPPFVLNECEAFTPFTYCWGARCYADNNPGRPNGAICECPYVTAPNPVNIQIDVNSCESQVGRTCEFLHNGNPDNFETEQHLLEMYNNITGKEVPIIPTCEEKPSEDPTDLTSIGCDVHDVGYCDNATWVYCIDAICEEPIGGVSTCYCWIQAPALSILPNTSTSGATCYQNNVNNRSEPYGEAMCESMKAGGLWSTFGGFGMTGGPDGATFGAKNTSYLPPFALDACPSYTGFAYCWGAACEPDPLDPENRAICRCPWVSSPNGAAIAIYASECEEQQFHTCDFTHNGGPRGSAVESYIVEAQAAAGCDTADVLLPTCAVLEEPHGFQNIGALDSRGGDLDLEQRRCGLTVDECADYCNSYGAGSTIGVCVGFTWVEGYNTGDRCCYPKYTINIPLVHFREGDIGGTYIRSTGLITPEPIA